MSVRNDYRLGRMLHSVQDYLIHLDQVVRVKTPAIDDVAIGRDETRRDQSASHQARPRRETRRNVMRLRARLPFCQMKAPIVGSETDHNVAVVAHVERSETFPADRGNRLHASIGLPDPGVLVKIAVVSAHDRITVGADRLRLAIESAARG